MTEPLPQAVPRRSYPLVVPPPGGFEEAVRRGRRIRRHRAGGGTGVAVFVAGALTWSLVGHGGSTTGLQPAQQPPAHHGVTLAESSAPTAEPAADQQLGTPAPVSGTRAGDRPLVPRPSQAGSTAVPRVTPRPGQVYAARGPITMSEPFTNTNANCIADTSTPDWCAYAEVQSDTPSTGTYTLSYSLCRMVQSGTSDLTFSRTQKADFAAINLAENDQVWTYSAGQPVVSDSQTVQVAGGQCYSWTVVWDGYDDFSNTPHQGQYRLVASSLATGQYPVAHFDFSHY